MTVSSFLVLTPPKINGWNLRIHPLKKENLPNHHDFRFDSLMFLGVVALVFDWFVLFGEVVAGIFFGPQKNMEIVSCIPQMMFPKRFSFFYVKLFIWGVTCRSDWMDWKQPPWTWTPFWRYVDLMNPSVFFGRLIFFREWNFGYGVRIFMSTSKTVVFSEKGHHFVRENWVTNIRLMAAMVNPKPFGESKGVWCSEVQ